MRHVAPAGGQLVTHAREHFQALSKPMGPYLPHTKNSWRPGATPFENSALKGRLAYYIKRARTTGGCTSPCA